MASHAFDDAFINSLTPRANRYEKFDSVWRGLAVRVAPNGRRTFMLWKSHEGVTYKQVLGDYPAMGVQDAREQAAKAFSEMLKGAPATTPKKLTVADVFHLYETERKLSASTLENIQLVKRLLIQWGWDQRDANSLTKDLVIEKHKALTSASGPIAANNYLGYVGAAYGYAMDRLRDDITGQTPILFNPIKTLTTLKLWNKKPRRTGHVKEADLQNFFMSLIEETKRAGHGRLKSEFKSRLKTRACIYIATSLLLGTRKTETGALRVDNFDIQARTLVFHDTKNGVQHHVPVGKWLFSALFVIREWSLEEHSPWMFPSKYGSKPHMSEPRETLQLIAKRVDLKVTMHDLRRTFATVLNRMSIQNYTMKRLLNHLYDPARDTDVTSGYVQVDMNELRSVIQALEDAVIQRPKSR